MNDTKLKYSTNTSLVNTMFAERKREYFASKHKSTHTYSIANKSECSAMRYNSSAYNTYCLSNVSYSQSKASYKRSKASKKQSEASKTWSKTSYSKGNEYKLININTLTN